MKKKKPTKKTKPLALHMHTLQWLLDMTQSNADITKNRALLMADHRRYGDAVDADKQCKSWLIISDILQVTMSREAGKQSKR